MQYSNISFGSCSRAAGLAKYDLNAKHRPQENEEHFYCNIANYLYLHGKHILYASDARTRTCPGNF